MPASTSTTELNCPKCQAAGVACRYNFFDRGDLQVHSWEHKCPNCGWRETHASRSDDPPEKQPPQPGVCPMCGRSGAAG
jgi:ssDNA-binding Zn-finger/Zn-ribbon topoisomerase 1